VTALITDTEQPLILGSEVIEQQNIVFLPKIRKAIFFKDETYEMMVDMVSWDDVKEKFHNTGTKQNLIHVSNEQVEKLKEQLTINFNNDIHSRKIIKIDNESKYDNINYLIEEIIKNPTKVLADIGGIYRRWMIFALIVMSNLFECPTIGHYTSDLRRTIYNHKADNWYSEGETKRRLAMKRVKENIKICKRMIQHAVTNKEVNITINSMEDISTAGKKSIDSTENELKKAQQEIAEIMKVYCTKDYEEFRPKEFPVELWKCVFDVEKEKVMPRYDELRIKVAYDTDAMIENQTEGEPFDREKLPKNRLMNGHYIQMMDGY